MRFFPRFLLSSVSPPVDVLPEEITPKLALKALVLAMEEYEQLRSAHTLSRLIPGLVPNAAHHVTKTHF
jgi:hypothetical protein